MRVRTWRSPRGGLRCALGTCRTSSMPRETSPLHWLGRPCAVLWSAHLDSVKGLAWVAWCSSASSFQHNLYARLISFGYPAKFWTAWNWFDTRIFTMHLHSLCQGNAHGVFSQVTEHDRTVCYGVQTLQCEGWGVMRMLPMEGWGEAVGLLVLLVASGYIDITGGAQPWPRTDISDIGGNQKYANVPPCGRRQCCGKHWKSMKCMVCSPFVLLYKVEEGLPGWSEKHRTALKQALRVRVFVAEEHTQKKDTLFSHIVIILHWGSLDSRDIVLQLKIMLSL